MNSADNHKPEAGEGISARIFHGLRCELDFVKASGSYARPSNVRYRT